MWLWLRNVEKKKSLSFPPPPWEPQTPFSSSGTLDFLSLCLGIDSLSFSSKEQVSFNFIAAVTICSDFGAQENKVSHCFYFFPIYLPWSDGTRCHDLFFWMLSFKPALSLSSFTCIKRLFNSSFCHKGGTICISEVINVFPSNLDSSLCFIQPTFSHDVLSCKLNKQVYSFPNLEPVCCSMSSSNCCFLTCIQIFQKAGKVVWYSHFFKNCPQFAVMHTVKGFSIVNEAEVDVLSNQISFVAVGQLWSPVWLFVTPWTASRQTSLSFIISLRLLKLMSIELVTPFNHLTLCFPLLFLPSIFPSIRVFSSELALHITWPE